MSIWKKAFYFALFGFLFVEVLILFPQKLENSLKNDKEPTQEEINKVETEEERQAILAKRKAIPVEQSMSGIDLVESQKGSRDWHLRASSAEGQQGVGTWHLNQVEVEFFQIEKIQFVAKGKQGAINSQTKDLEIKGDVSIKSANGYQLSTSDIKYQSIIRQISSLSEVEVLGPSLKESQRMRLTAGSMKAQVDESAMEMTGPVKATQPAKDSQTFEIEAGFARLSGKSREMNFSEGVKLKYRGSLMTAPQAKFIFGSLNNQLEFVELTGGVKINDVEKFATSEKILLDLNKAEFVLSGKPHVFQGEDELVGEKIIFVDNGRKVRVEKAKAKVEQESVPK